MTTRVLVVDDQALVRGGLVALLTAAPGLEVAGAAADGAEAVALASQTRPDVILMDIRMPVLDGIAATRRILAGPDGYRPRILVLTTFDLDEYVYTALAEGASGFLLKDTPPDRIISAVHAVAAGDVLLAPLVTQRLVESFARHHRAAAAKPHLEQLTARETEVLRLVGNGLTNAQIAHGLVLSEATVKTHVKRVMAKLHLTSRAQAVVMAYETGLVVPNSPDDGRAQPR
jgi:DNA-binding NarL/FixJ family response regulator